MPNLYFWEPEKQNHGILQAVLPWEASDRVVDRALAIRLGDEFPIELLSGAGCAVVILYVRPEEANEDWIAGFYRIDADLTGIHAAPRDPPKKPREN